MLPLPTALGMIRPSGGSASAYIASVQNIEITIPINATSATATITSVDTSRTLILYQGFTTTDTSTTWRLISPRLELTNATTITAFRDTLSATNTVTVRAQVIEFTASTISRIQYGTVNVAASTAAGTATITSVDTSRSVVFWLGQTNTTSASSLSTVISRIDLTNATTVSATRASVSTAVLTVGFCVVEFATGIVNSVQQRSITLTGSATTATDTISSVNTGRTLLIFNSASSSSSAVNNWFYHMQLTGSTSVLLTRTGTLTTSRTVNYTVLEFTSAVVNSLQRGTININSVTSADATITSVDTSRSILNFAGFSSNAGVTDERQASIRMVNSTTIRGQKNTAGTFASTVAYEAVQLN